MKEKIIIQGAPPKWNQAEYESKVEGWIRMYRGTEQSMERVRATFEHDLLQAVIDKSKEGYTVAVNKHVFHGELAHEVWMVKPESQQTQDIEVIKAKVKAEYVAHLEAEHARYQDLLRQQLIQTLEEKERKAAEEAKAKKLAKIEAEVQACYAPLEIPE
ncbi:conserved protein of unknown function [Pseudomonas sp. JV551A1]|uniref:Uncharacterized protein n=1 Tax=Pseudomonas inefficax TaxID=2078786 RepID=A0AAQ1PBU5_9PSED|nr:hypothetical protein [Pseudomonas]SPO56630.1 conserved protein of unknown function [Pseudomonas sp. JV551A1]SPO62782.1 conserved protein of unknown function [Pseudomonas inefficax]